MPTHASPASLAAIVASASRQTGPRRAVADLVAAQHGHFTAADLAAAAAARGIALGRATIFRTLELLLSAGALERIDLPGGSHAYVACEPAHHHHAICSRCSRVADFDDADLAAVVAGVAARTGFRIDSHRLELFGLCRACQAAEAADAAAAVEPGETADGAEATQDQEPTGAAT